jgi:hypothetical protein
VPDPATDLRLPASVATAMRGIDAQRIRSTAARRQRPGHKSRSVNGLSDIL